MRENEFFKNNSIPDILNQLNYINDYIGGKSRENRGKKADKLDKSSIIHKKAEALKFYLGYYKNLEWIDYLGESLTF